MMSIISEPAHGRPVASPDTLPPGPRRPVMLQMLNQAFRPHTWLQRCYERYGDVFTVRLPGEGTMVFLSDPGDVKAVFTGDASVLEAGAARHLMEPVFGSHSVLLLDA